MRTRQSEPMEEASKVLTLKTILIFNKCPNFNRFGMKVLDILAVNEPEKLEEMESSNKITKMLMRVLDLQNQVCEALTSQIGIEQLANGMVEMEILEMHGIEITL